MDIPKVEDLEGKSIPELREMLDRYGDRYSNRFGLKIDDYREITHFYISCSMMHENLSNGWRRWWRITVPVTESRWEQE